MTGRVILLIAVVGSVLVVAVFMLWPLVATGPLVDQPGDEGTLSFVISAPSSDDLREVRFGAPDVDGLGLTRADWPLRRRDQYDIAVVDTGVSFLTSDDPAIEYCFIEPVLLIVNGEPVMEVFEPGECVSSEEPYHYPLGRLPE